MSSLLRSTKFVRYFTGAARTLLLNSAKTADTNSLINPKAICSINSILMRDYATKKKESLEPLLLRLDSEVRRFGRIAKKDIDEVFEEISSRSDITSSQSLLVIRCCGELVPEELPEQRTQLVQKIWSVLTERGIPMDISHYNALLRVYLENEHAFSPAKFLEELEQKGLQPNRVTYQRLMWRYCQEGDVEGATKVLERMRELKFPVSEPVLNALVMGHAFHGDTEGAQAVVETMAGAGLQPTNRTYTLLACGYAKKGDIAGIENVMKTAKDVDEPMTDKDILEIVEHLALGGHGDKVEQIFPHIQKSIGYNQEVCNLILRLLNKGQDETAKKVMKTMPKTANVDDTPFKGAFFVKHLVRLNRPADSVIKTCLELKADGLVPSAIYIATECALQHTHTELAQKLFEELKQEGMEIRQHFYWPLLVHKVKENDEEGLLQILRNMANNGVGPSGEALRDYVIPYLIKYNNAQNVILKLQIANVPVIHSARNLMVELLEKGDIKMAANVALQYCPRGQYSLVSRPLLNALNKTQNIDSFVTITHVISSKLNNAQMEQDEDAEDNESIHEVSRLVKSAVKILSKPELCETLLTACHSKGLRIDMQTAEAIEHYLGEKMTTRLSELLSQLTSSDLEALPIENRKSLPTRNSAQLEQLMAQIKSKGGSNVNRLQKQLIAAYIKEKNVDKLNSFLEEIKSTEFELSISSLAQLFEFYCEHDDITTAKNTMAQLQEKNPNFVLNKYKRVLMSYALVRANQFEEAVQYLKQFSDDENDSGFLMNSKCWQMLNKLAEDKEDAKVKEMTKVLIEKKYIAPSNVILGPSIKVHLLKEDIDAALKEFEFCCKEYRCTPWKGQLMKALIGIEDASRLQWLADLSTQIHGEVNILHDLVLAFVECGRLRQARRILETPGLQTRHRRLEEACLRYVDEGKSEYLEGLLEATKELSHIDRSNIFYHLLSTYCKADETDKALGLWTLLQEDGEVPNDQFLLHLGKHLKSKNRQVPFIMPEENIPVKVAKTENTEQKTSTPKKDPRKPTKGDVSKDIENLVKEGKAAQAMDLVIKCLKDGVVPETQVLKYTLKALGEEGNVEKIQQMGAHINESFKRRVAYDDKLTLATFNRGAGMQHVDSVLVSVNAAKTEEDLLTALKKFPRSSSLASVLQNEELLAKCTQIAEVAASKGHFLPANLLWMEYVLSGKEKEADDLWQKWLISSPNILFRRLLQESHLRKEPQLIEKLIATLKTNKIISISSLGNVYSRLINYYLTENQIDEANSTLNKAVQSGLSVENINENSRLRLKKALEEAGK